MEIKCCACGKHMGVIRDATLRKHISYLCGPCKDELLKPKSEYDRSYRSYEEILGVFGNIFKDKK